MALGSTNAVPQSRETLRNLMVTSMMGRRAGMDINGYEVGEQDTRLVVDAITTTAATSMNGAGATLLAATAASSAVYTILNPVAGVYKLITQLTSATTLGYAVQFGANANIVTTAGSSFNQIVFGGVGHVASLFCASTGGSSAGGPVWITCSPAITGMSFSTY